MGFQTLACLEQTTFQNELLETPPSLFGNKVYQTKLLVEFIYYFFFFCIFHQKKQLIRLSLYKSSLLRFMPFI